ncbi:MAG: PDZ domain-containing protein [Planctomycetes bacterium]|nr:PDZ domain-containing protein [Planctomycetota bacterium]
MLRFAPAPPAATGFRRRAAGGLLAVLCLLLPLGGGGAGAQDPAGPAPAGAARDPYAAGWIGASFGRPPSGQGIAVNAIEPGAPAEKAGLQAGDVILGAQGRPADDVFRFLSAVKAMDPGATLTLDILRAGGRRTVNVVLGAKRVRASLEAAAARGFDWLVKEQLPGGAWPRLASQVSEGHVNPSSTITALALLALAGAPAPLRATHAAAVDRGVAFLLANQSPEGWVGDAEEAVRLQNYTTSLTMQALLLLDPEKHAAAVARMREYLEKAQLTEQNRISDLDWLYGSWNYYDEVRTYSLRGDVSIVSFVMDGLHAAALPLDRPAWSKALGFLRRCQSLEDDPALVTEQDDGGFFFNPRASKAGEVSYPGNRIKFRSYGSATCDGLRALLAAGVAKDDPRVAAAYAWLEKHYTLRENPGFLADLPVAYWSGIFFYYYHGLARALDCYGGEVLTTPDGAQHYWAREIGDWLSTLQKKEGHWVNPNNVMNEDDPLLSTSLALITLNTAMKHMK